MISTKTHLVENEKIVIQKCNIMCLLTSWVKSKAIGLHSWPTNMWNNQSKTLVWRGEYSEKHRDMLRINRPYTVTKNGKQSLIWKVVPWINLQRKSLNKWYGEGFPLTKWHGMFLFFANPLMALKAWQKPGTECEVRYVPRSWPATR